MRSNSTSKKHFRARLPWCWLLFAVAVVFFTACKNKAKPKSSALPNIVILLVDDLGYGDLGVYNGNSLIPTPNLDRLASEGIRLTDAYCPVSVCSPSRFALMTGSYPFRSWKKSGVMANYEPSMIAQNQLTLPQMLQQSGYTTAGFGKWHLGATFPTLDGERPQGYGKFKAENNGANIDLARPISDGPVAHGFDHWFGFSCASECWVIEGKNIVAALQHDFYNIESAQNREHIQIIPSDAYLETIVERSVRFVEEQVTTSNNHPFFLYFAPYVPHIPLSVSEEFKGTTKAGLYGDYVHELDTAIGKLLKTLDEFGQTENTIVIFASDNGSQFEVTSTQFDMTKASNSPKDVRKKGQGVDVHFPNGDLRGTKWTIWEGGVRTPLLARWPGKFPAGTTSNGIFALNDIMATLASVVDYELPENTAVDSYNQLDLLMGGNKAKMRKSVIMQSSKGQLGIREGQWKYIESDEENGVGELYDLNADISESKNLAQENLEIVEQMRRKLQDMVKTSSHEQKWQ